MSFADVQSRLDNLRINESLQRAITCIIGKPKTLRAFSVLSIEHSLTLNSQQFRHGYLIIVLHWKIYIFLLVKYINLITTILQAKYWH